MKKILIRTSLVLLLVFGMAANAAALPLMSGGISFAGGATVNAGNKVLDATAFLSFVNPIVTTGDGTWSGVTAGTPAVFKPFTFIPASNVTELWKFTFGGITYQLNATGSSMSFAKTPGAIPSLEVFGTGTIIASNTYDPTPGAYRITAQQGSTTVSFSSSSVAVPEPFTLILLGTGLLGLIGIRRKLS